MGTNVTWVLKRCDNIMKRRGYCFAVITWHLANKKFSFRIQLSSLLMKWNRIRECHTVCMGCDTDCTIKMSYLNILSRKFAPWIACTFKEISNTSKLKNLTSIWHETWPFYDVNRLNFISGYQTVAWEIHMTSNWFSLKLVVAVKRYRHCLNNQYRLDQQF